MSWQTFASTQSKHTTFFFSAVDGGYLFQGDMVFGKEDIENAVNGKDPSKGEGHGYSLLRNKNSRWHNGEVPYVLDDSVSKWMIKSQFRLTKIMPGIR